MPGASGWRGCPSAHACSAARSPTTSPSPTRTPIAPASSRRPSPPGLQELLAQLPDGLDTRIGEGGRGLSAGQAQRIGLARAFLRDAHLVVLDEPTAHLDSETAAAVGGAIVALAAGRTTLLITHDAALTARTDRVVMLPGAVAVPASSATPLAVIA